MNSLVKLDHNSKHCYCQRVSVQYLLLTLAVLFLITGNCLALVKISSLLIPSVIENGTEDSVVLDCIYTLDPKVDTNLVVKWFLNDDPEPIYQWIPEFDTRHASLRLQGRINMDYAVDSGDSLINYRALNILKPTIDLSGRYSCHVISLQSQDSKEGTMIVYALPTSIVFNCSTESLVKKSSALRSSKDKTPLGKTSFNDNARNGAKRDSEDATILKCEVRDVYPIPEITMYSLSDDGRNPRALTLLSSDVHQTSNGAFNAHISSQINDEHLITSTAEQNEPKIFECLVSMPDAKYEKTKRFIYMPLDKVSANTGSGRNTSHHYFVMTLISALIIKFI